MKILRLLVALAATLAWPPAWGWNDHGHLLVADVAWQRLPASARDTVAAALRQHPRFDVDFEGRMPDDIRHGSSSRRARWIFSHAATWPDIARGYGGALKARYHRPTWHYVNHPLYLTEADRDTIDPNLPANIRTQWAPAMDEDGLNATQALLRAVTLLQDPRTASAAKAVLYCWLLHLAGDLHQPMHAASLFSRRTFPSGDRGGNGIPTTVDGSVHAYWDRILGRSVRPANIRNRARSLLRDDDLAALAGAAAATPRDFALWRDEGYDLAWNFAYTEPVLDAVASVEDGSGDAKNIAKVTLDGQYRDTAREVARARVVQAGARLAAVLAALH